MGPVCITNIPNGISDKTTQTRCLCLLQFTCILVWGKLSLITMWLLRFITVEIFKEKFASVSRSYASIIEVHIFTVLRNVRLIHLKPGYAIISLHSYICICTGINFARFYFTLLICRMVKTPVTQFGVVFLDIFLEVCTLHCSIYSNKQTLLRQEFSL